jgi:coenzyme F420-reducing hydrogenase gamma subunit
MVTQGIDRKCELDTEIDRKIRSLSDPVSVDIPVPGAPPRGLDIFSKIFRPCPTIDTGCDLRSAAYGDTSAS